MEELNASDRADVIKKLARSLLAFQDSFLSRDNSPVGLLCQVWLPHVTDAGAPELKTKGFPFCVAGMGDLLALFRCISCRFNFSADPVHPERMGAPGRVFLSGEPELACNVQLYPRDAYLRRAEAEQCRVQSSMLLPLFPSSGSNVSSGAISNAVASSCEGGGSGANTAAAVLPNIPGRGMPLGVIEVVQTSDDMEFIPVAQLLAIVLERCGLGTSSTDEVQARLPTSATSLQLPLRTGLLEPISGQPLVSEDVTSSGDPRQQQQGEGGGKLARGTTANGDDVYGRGQRRRSGEGVRPAMPALDEEYDYEDNEMGEAGSEGEGSEEQSEEGGGGEGPSTSSDLDGGGGGGGGRRMSSRRRQQQRIASSAKSAGIKLSLQDLQGQFGVGLKDAASALGVCTTTLKRACRRHGIQRWPRRALQKVAKALDEMERKGTMHEQAAMPPRMAPYLMSGGGGGGGGGVVLTGPAAAAAAAGGMLMPPLGLPYPGAGTVDMRWSALASMIPPAVHGGQHKQSSPPPPLDARGAFAAWVGMNTGVGSGGGGGGAIAAPSEASLPDGALVMPGGGSAQAATRDAALGGGELQHGGGAKLAATAFNLGNGVNVVPGAGASVASGMSGWDTGTAAAALHALHSMQKVQQQQHQQHYAAAMWQQQQQALQGGGAGGAPSAPSVGGYGNSSGSGGGGSRGIGHREVMPSPFIEGPGGGKSYGTSAAPVAQGPGGGGGNNINNNDANDNTNNAAGHSMPIVSDGPALSFGPGFSLPNFSQMSGPSFNPSMFQGLSFGVLGAGAASPRAGPGGTPPDDVGLLDSSILELMMSEDSRSLVGATDEDLQRLFDAAGVGGGGGGGGGGAGRAQAPCHAGAK